MDLILSILLALLSVDTIKSDYGDYDLQPNGWYFPISRKRSNFRNYHREEVDFTPQKDWQSPPPEPDDVYFEASDGFEERPPHSKSDKRAINKRQRNNRLLDEPNFSFDLHERLVFGEVDDDDRSEEFEWSEKSSKDEEEVVYPGMGGRQTICEDECKTTMQYDPMCGDNGRTYYNNQRFLCAQKCGIDVSLLHHGRCV